MATKEQQLKSLKDELDKKYNVKGLQEKEEKLARVPSVSLKDHKTFMDIPKGLKERTIEIPKSLINKTMKGVADKTADAIKPAKFKFLMGGGSYPRFGSSGNTRTTTPQMSIIKDNIKKVKPKKPVKDFVPPTDAEYAGMSTSDRERIKRLTQDIPPDWVVKGRAEEEARKKRESKTGLY